MLHNFTTLPHYLTLHHSSQHTVSVAVKQSKFTANQSHQASIFYSRHCTKSTLTLHIDVKQIMQYQILPAR